MVNKTSYSKLFLNQVNTHFIRAKDLWGAIGEPVSIKFTIKAPLLKQPLST